MELVNDKASVRGESHKGRPPERRLETSDGLTNEEHLKAVADLFLRGLEPEESGEEEQGRR